MKTITRVSLAFAILTACAFAQAPALPQFSADINMTNQRMPEPTKGKIFFDKGNMRMDMTMPAGRGPMGGEMSVIRDNNAKTTYMLMHEMKSYIETKDGAQRMGRMM